MGDAEGLCARSVTSCERADQMIYQVYNCENITEVYEDRSYYCYGAFEENGLVYTVVKRLDLPYRECFVGITLDEGRSMITEAGTSCGRNKEPGTSGMLLSYRSDHCVEWQWEDTISEVSLAVNDVVDIKHRPKVNIEVTLKTTTSASKLPKEMNEEIARISKEILQHEILVDDKKITEVSSSANFVHFSLALIALTLSQLLLM